MKLFEHPDFEQAIIHAAEYFHSSGMREAVIEKDYYVTDTTLGIFNAKKTPENAKTQRNFH